MEKKQTCCICSCIKNEHDFINRWLEYHINIGISHFYLLVDNLYEIQKPYIINDLYKDKVTLVNADKNYAIKHKILENKDSKNSNILIHRLINTLVPLVKEDWVALCALDNYIYLYKNIDDFLTCINKENSKCSQIIMPWINIANLDNNDISNFPLDLGHNTYYHIPVKSCQSIIKTSNLSHIHDNSHFFITKTEKQIIYINNSYKSMPNELDTQYIFNLSSNYWQPLINKGEINIFKSPFIIHIIIRTYNEILIKDCLSWKKDNKDLNLKNFLLFKTNKINSHLSCRSAYLYNINKYYIFKLKLSNFQHINLNDKNSNIYYQELIHELLNINAIDIETYEQWKSYIKQYVNFYFKTRTKLTYDKIPSIIV